MDVARPYVESLAGSREPGERVYEDSLFSEVRRRTLASAAVLKRY